jgi:hypothetical protein
VVFIASEPSYIKFKMVYRVSRLDIAVKMNLVLRWKVNCKTIFGKEFSYRGDYSVLFSTSWKKRRRLPAIHACNFLEVGCNLHSGDCLIIDLSLIQLPRVRNSHLLIVRNLLTSYAQPQRLDRACRKIAKRTVISKFRENHVTTALPTSWRFTLLRKPRPW